MKEEAQSPVLVIGLGRFGSSTALTLQRLGREVLAVEQDAHLVQEWTGRLTHVVEADTTNIEALRQIGASEFDTAVIGIGTSVEASVLTCANLSDLGIGQIWAKSISVAHGRILSRIGAHHVLYPESDAGARVAHLVSSRMLDYIEFDEGHFAVVKIPPPLEVQGKLLSESRIRDNYDVTVVGIKSPGKDFTYAEPSTYVSPDDMLLVAGQIHRINRFAARP
ncbi:potassium channel family protein [Sediminivirga luteola]|jgi:trk system potassium uptake protein TrkA|uniref:Potassium transporter n=1 Tax=Sediminivirga luteola TaxID=1774748 RepID=A0A8J2TV22_9MICO|nr:TrkA family potassium uptake protein [Sediminivirga luteola]MCI2264738.1 TrkA family potassium uptake protein [Sediminivirga luteola]GGA02100.1 potassium transporter [Sediminivirga luteola]